MRIGLGTSGMIPGRCLDIFCWGLLCLDVGTIQEGLPNSLVKLSLQNGKRLTSIGESIKNFEERAGVLLLLYVFVFYSTYSMYCVSVTKAGILRQATLSISGTKSIRRGAAICSKGKPPGQLIVMATSCGTSRLGQQGKSPEVGIRNHRVHQ